jgi:sphingomyelin phosphodiesterase 2
MLLTNYCKLHAPYEREPNDSYLCHRTAQAWEIAKLMKGAAERGHFVIGLGDFNMIPLSLAHRVVTVHGRVKDIWRILHPDSSVGSSHDLVEQARRRPIPTAIHNILENGTTCDSVLNTWRWNKSRQKRLGPNQPRIDVPPDTVDPGAKRLDYIFVSGSQERGNGGWVVKAAKVGMMERHPTLQCSLSDHFSVQTTLAWQSRQDDRADRGGNGISRKSREGSRKGREGSRKGREGSRKGREGSRKGREDSGKAEDDGVQTIEDSGQSRQDVRKAREGSRNAKEDAFLNGSFSQNQPASSPSGHSQTQYNPQLYAAKELYLPIPTYNEILIIIAKYAMRERKQRRYRLYHFMVSVIISIGCLAAVWWSPLIYITFVLMLLSTLGLSAGVVNGLIGGLFVGSELRALKEFEWEIRNARAAAGYGAGGGDVYDEGVRDW